jgi:hypothetical protein
MGRLGFGWACRKGVLMKFFNLASCITAATLLAGGFHQTQAQTLPSSKIDNSVFSLTMPSGWMSLSSTGIPGIPQAGSDSTGFAIHTTLGGVFCGLYPYSLDVDPTDIPDDAADQIPSSGTVDQISTGTKTLGTFTWNVTQFEWTDESGDKYRSNVYFCKVKNDAYFTLVASPTEPTTNIATLVAAAETGLATLVIKGGGASIHQALAMTHLKRQAQMGSGYDVLGRNVAFLPKMSHFSRQFMRP